MYWFLRNLTALLIRILFGLKAEGVENVPEGGAIIAATHSSFLDPLAVAGILSRPIHFMAKAELFKYPVFSFVLPRVHAFPVRRGLADRNAIREAMKLVDEGNLLGIFPEGTRSKTGEIQPLQGGTAMIAIKAGVPVVPVVVVGVKPLRLRRSIEVRIGTPIRFGEPHRASKDEVSAAGEQISQQFTTLLGRNLPEHAE